ncbi:MAG: CDP-2,3-bis-(O-geranylgeranyl)-sn-glycerol synthase [Candidatus Thermoplasmatota archaeon]
MRIELVIIQALWLVLPAYIANASALLLGGSMPVDFGKKWRDGKRLLGDGKTWMGLLFGTLIGMVGGFGLSVAAKYVSMNPDFSFLGLNDFMGFPFMIPIVFSLCFGALLGDLIESFFKRRAGIKRGGDWIPFDQLDFILGVLFLSFLVSGLLYFFGFTSYNWFTESFSFWHMATLIILTPFFHLFANFVNKMFQPEKRET